MGSLPTWLWAGHTAALDVTSAGGGSLLSGPVCFPSVPAGAQSWLCGCSAAKLLSGIVGGAYPSPALPPPHPCPIPAEGGLKLQL